MDPKNEILAWGRMGIRAIAVLVVLVIVAIGVGLYIGSRTKAAETRITKLEADLKACQSAQTP